MIMLKVCERGGFGSRGHGMVGLADCLITGIETQAALEAGMTPVVVVREGNAPLSEEEWRTWGESVVESFDQVGF